MHKATAVTFPKDGPKTALHKMKEIGTSSILVVDKERRLLGIVHAEEASRLVKAGETSLEAIIVRDIPRVEPGTALQELFSIESFPVVVVNEEQKLKGIIVRGALLAAMAEGRSN
jgi:glycine betaine/proline transport system ATP-binding protein